MSYAVNRFFRTSKTLQKIFRFFKRVRAFFLIPSDRRREKNRSFPFYLSVCAIFKNEAPYLREWIEYHRMIGVEHFFLYDNGSTDASGEILAPYVREGIVDLIVWPAEKHPHKPQYNSYRDCLRRRRNQSFWIAFLDLDEYVLLMEDGKTIVDFLKGYENTNGLGINWRIYGSSGHKARPEGLTLENYHWRASDDFDPNRQIKSVVNPRKTVDVGDSHWFHFLDGGCVMDEAMLPIKNERWTQRSNGRRIRINHYFHRSDEEAEAKRLRGRATGGFRKPEEFAAHNRNDVYDPVMQKYVGPLKKRMAER